MVHCNVANRTEPGLEIRVQRRAEESPVKPQRFEVVEMGHGLGQRSVREVIASGAEYPEPGEPPDFGGYASRQPVEGDLQHLEPGKPPDFGGYAPCQLIARE